MHIYVLCCAPHLLLTHLFSIDLICTCHLRHPRLQAGNVFNESDVYSFNFLSYIISQLMAFSTNIWKVSRLYFPPFFFLVCVGLYFPKTMKFKGTFYTYPPFIVIL